MYIYMREHYYKCTQYMIILILLIVILLIVIIYMYACVCVWNQSDFRN